MTRWARKNQSHSNKTEEATPWKEMVNQSKPPAQKDDGEQSNVEKSKKRKFKETKPVESTPEEQVADKNADKKKKTMDELEKMNPMDGSFKKNQDHKKDHRVKKNKNGYIDLEPEVEKRIQDLKRDLHKKGSTNEEIRQIIRRERRTAENKRKTDLKKRCFKCRKPGHNLSDCPQITSSVDQASGLCFKCGSTEHDISKCSVKTKDFPFAKCFVCGEQGHLSRQCPDNPRGMYPNGGCCRNCGSVEHFKKDCPTLQEKSSEVFAERMSSKTSVDAEEFATEAKPVEVKKRNVVKF